MARLEHVSATEPGYLRRRCGKGWTYVDPDGRRVTDAEVLARIAGLVIPPAWRDVWICVHEHGHLQATGFDVKGRRQYRYHDQWRVARDREKFDRMIEFGTALPRLRAACLSAIIGGGTSREAALGGAVRLLDLGCFRIGSDKSAEANETFGLTTLERRHVHVSPPTIRFDYPGKAGVHQQTQVVDVLAAELVARLKRRRGSDPRLLAYQLSRAGEWRALRPEDVNAFIAEATSGPFTAKDFRTLRATVLAAGELARVAVRGTDVGRRGGAPSEAARKRAVAGVMRRVSGFLGNTPTVCRASYVDPRVVERYMGGATVADRNREVATLVRSGADLTATVPQAILEGSVLPWLARETRSAHRTVRSRAA